MFHFFHTTNLNMLLFLNPSHWEGVFIFGILDHLQLSIWLINLEENISHWLWIIKATVCGLKNDDYHLKVFKTGYF